MTDRLLSRDVRTQPGPAEAIDPNDVLAGTPEATTIPLTTLGEAEFGIWELTAGSVRDTEADEIFVVLSGHGSVEFGDGTSIELSEGVAVRLRAGDRTVWTIDQTLRKIYIAI